MLAALPVLAAGGNDRGQKLFTVNCSGCHAGGQNIIDPKHPIIGSSKLASVDAFKAQLSTHKGGMPAFKKIAGNNADLKALLDYCKSLKK